MNKNLVKIILWDPETGKTSRVSNGRDIPVTLDGETVQIAGFEIPTHNYIALTYVAAGNGAGEIETVVYKTGGSGGTTVAILTLAYNASNEISSITKS